MIFIPKFNLIDFHMYNKIDPERAEYKKKLSY